MRSDFPDRWVVGIDDTDMPSMGGTGQLARRIADEIEQLGLGTSAGVTRHQLFEGPGVPKTSRNSAAAIEFISVDPADRTLDAIREMVEREAVPGSDPGLAVATSSLATDVLVFARSAQSQVVTQADARAIAARGNVALEGIGGDEGGVIGALAAVGLRADGNDGRFVGLRGIREVSGVLSVQTILDRTAVVAVLDDAGGHPLAPAVLVDLGDWVRPRLVDGKPVLAARYDGERWRNADARPH